MTTTSHGNPIVEAVEGDNRVKVYEEVPGQLTISFSKSPGMWSGFTVPAEAAQLVGNAIDAALAAREGEEYPETVLVSRADLSEALKTASVLLSTRLTASALAPFTRLERLLDPATSAETTEGNDR